MLWPYYLRRLYSLDTLDTRCTAESHRSTKTETRIDSAQHASRPHGGKENDSRSPRWRTPEFMFYYLVFITVVPMMFKVAHDVSKGERRSFSGATAVLAHESAVPDFLTRDSSKLPKICSPFVTGMDPWSQGGKWPPSLYMCLSLESILK